MAEKPKKRKKYNPEKANWQLKRNTTIAMVICGGLLFVAVLFQLFGMMVLDHDKYESAAINNQARSTAIWRPPRRSRPSSSTRTASPRRRRMWTLSPAISPASSASKRALF